MAEEIQGQAGCLYRAEPPLLRILSSLAEGADRIVAEEALEKGFELQCPLPFSRKDYAEDFECLESLARFDELVASADSVIVLDGPTQNDRSAAYLNAGRVILRQCDVLLAIWGGGPPRGLGGTGQIVAEAAGLEIPTIWIDPKLPNCVRLSPPKLTSQVTGSSPVGLSEEAEAFCYLRERLQGILLLSTKPSQTHDTRFARLTAWFLGMLGILWRPSERERALKFFSEDRPRGRPGFIFRRYRYLWVGPQGRWEEDPRCSWTAFATAWPQVAEKIERHYGAPFRLADELANRCVGKYRSSFVASYLLGAFAVLCAFFGVVALREVENGHAGRNWFIAELVLIIAIILATLYGRGKRWHERWMDARMLAESLRQMQFLALLARVISTFKVPAHLDAGDPRQSWVIWYVRSLVREAGLMGRSSGQQDWLPLEFDHRYLEGVRSVLSEAVCDQVRYHTQNHKIFHALHHRSHVAAQILFGLAALGCFLHLLHWFPDLDVLLSFGAIVLPGFGAALSAVLHQGEFERIAVRSHALESRLRSLLAHDLGAAGSSSQELAQVADIFSDLMMGELVDWRFAFLGKSLVLPA